MSSNFTPIEELELFCRHCGKIMPAQLDRSIAENGRTVDKNSTFEYYCTKCSKTVCYTGTDLLEQTTEEMLKLLLPPVSYSMSSHFVVGEKINHKKFKVGTVVGKDHGTPSKILVNFDKTGIKKLIQDL